MAGIIALPWVLGLLLLVPGLDDSAVKNPSATVGMKIRLSDVVLPGSQLEARPISDTDPLVLRVVAIYPHGTARRYDLECYGLEAGDYDLAKWLQHIDGSPTDDLPPIPVTVRSVLPPGRIKPHRPEQGGIAGLGGYHTLLIGACVLWVIGLGVIILGRRKRPAGAGGAEAGRPRTLAERLRPVVEKALAGTLSPQERAELELGLVAYWRRRLGLDADPPAEALAKLKNHEEAGPLLEALENWLHRPVAREGVDLEGLLRPYAHLPADALENAVAG